MTESVQKVRKVQNGGVPHETERERPAHLRRANLALVFGGGAAGVLARELLMLAVPDLAGLPLAVLIANLLGALMLGVLLTVLAEGAETGRRRKLRLLLGTGLLGGFTTYSALAQAVVLLAVDEAVVLALCYGLGTVLLGGLATWLGVLLGAARAGHRREGGGRRRGVGGAHV